MELRNSSRRFGVIDMTFHWLVAAAVFSLFGLGYWMVDLAYYHEWYRLAPHIHRSVGILLLGVVLLRLAWRLVEKKPPPLKSHAWIEAVGARLAHVGLYVLMLVVMISGYLISTADGSSIDVFGWFEVPSVTGRVRRMEDLAGDVHYWATWALVSLAGVHALAAIKHHLMDRDDTLRRMLPVRLKDNE